MRVWDLNPCTLILDRLKEKDVVSHTRLHLFRTLSHMHLLMLASIILHPMCEVVAFHS